MMETGLRLREEDRFEFGELVLVFGMEHADVPDFALANIGHPRVEQMPFALIHAALACAPWAQCVVSPLVGVQFDALDVAHQLKLANYTGRYLVVMPAVPRPEIIKREISAIHPGLQVEFVPKAPH